MFGFGKKKQKQDDIANDRVGYEPYLEVNYWQTAPINKVYRIPADHEAVVYDYDGRPLDGIPANTRFLLSAVPANVIIRSIYTGTISETGDFNDIAYSYNGQIIGFCKSHADAIKKLMLAGYRVDIEAYINGYNDELGYPYITGLFGFVDDATYMSLEK